MQSCSSDELDFTSCKNHRNVVNQSIYQSIRQAVLKFHHPLSNNYRVIYLMIKMNIIITGIVIDWGRRDEMDDENYGQLDNK